MKTKILVFLTSIILLSCQSSSSQNSNEKDVKSMLASYINAGDTNDVKKLTPHLHDNFRVTLYDGKKDAVSILDKSTYISFIETKKFGGYKRTANYESLQFIGNNMVSVKAILTSPGKPTLKNFYSLVKIKGNWLVIQDYVTLVP